MMTDSRLKWMKGTYAEQILRGAENPLLRGMERHIVELIEALDTRPTPSAQSKDAGEAVDEAIASLTDCEQWLYAEFEPLDEFNWNSAVGKSIKRARSAAKALEALKSHPVSVAWEQWRPIGEADGSRCIGFDTHRGVAICHLEKSSGKWYPSDEAEKFDGFFQPTHFMPLPQPPSEEPQPGSGPQRKE